MDSLVQQQVVAALTRQSESEGETVTDIVVYDTGKPVIDSTGRPPVRAELHRVHRQTRRSGETVQADRRSEKQVAGNACLKIESQTAADSTEEKKPSPGAGVLRTGIGALLLTIAAFAIRIIYKRIKF